MNLLSIEEKLISEIKLNPIQAKVFLFVVTNGKSSISDIVTKLQFNADDVLNTCKELVELGGFIDMSETEFEAMHPRFTAVNMYRKMCTREKIEFKRNDLVDNIGIALERPYDAARTK